MTDLKAVADPAAASSPTPAQAAPAQVKSVLLRRARELALVPALLLLLLLGSLVNDSFFTERNLISILGASAALAMVVLAEKPLWQFLVDAEPEWLVRQIDFRYMSGSDWPVCRLASSYGEVLETARVLTAGLDTHERQEVFGGTADRVYGLREGARPGELIHSVR